MRNILHYFYITFKIDIKRVIVYPGSFWLVVFVVPFYSLMQILFIETIFLHTNSYLGYSKYQAYILIGTFRIVQSIAYFFFYARLIDLNKLVRGQSGETFDNALIRPIDTQLYTTFGRYALGNIGPLLFGIGILFFGIMHAHIILSLQNVLSYAVLIILGCFIVYFVFLFLQTFLFWSPELQFTESLWDVYQEFGQYPTKAYTGTLGIFLNILVPITLMGAIPTNFLLGQISLYMLFVYAGIVLLLFFLTRLFWKFSIKKYASFSS